MQNPLLKGNRPFWLIAIWALIGAIALIFKIRLFIMLFEVIGVLFVIAFAIFTIFFILKKLGKNKNTNESV